MQHQRRIVAEPPKRVLVLGSPGAGKARIAGLIAERFGLPVVSLEREAAAFPGNGVDEAFRAKVAELAGEDVWAMTGNFPETFDLRVPRADWIVFLNVPMSVCLMRALREVLRQEKVAREGGHRAGPLGWRRLREVWAFPAEIAPRIMSAIERERRNRTIFILHSTRDVSQFVAKLNGADRPAQDQSSGGRSA